MNDKQLTDCADESCGKIPAVDESFIRSVVSHRGKFSPHEASQQELLMKLVDISEDWKSSYLRISIEEAEKLRGCEALNED